MPCGDFQHQSKADSGSRLSVYFIIINYKKIRKKTNVLPPLSPTPVPLCVIDIIMGTDHLKHTHTEGGNPFTITADTLCVG